VTRSLQKYGYYVKRELKGYGRLDVLMNDFNIEDIKCTGHGKPVDCALKNLGTLRARTVFVLSTFCPIRGDSLSYQNMWLTWNRWRLGGIIDASNATSEHRGASISLGTRWTFSATTMYFLGWLLGSMRSSW